MSCINWVCQSILNIQWTASIRCVKVSSTCNELHQLGVSKYHQHVMNCINWVCQCIINIQWTASIGCVKVSSTYNELQQLRVQKCVIASIECVTSTINMHWTSSIEWAKRNLPIPFIWHTKLMQVHCMLMMLWHTNFDAVPFMLMILLQCLWWWTIMKVKHNILCFTFIIVHHHKHCTLCRGNDCPPSRLSTITNIAHNAVSTIVHLLMVTIVHHHKHCTLSRGNYCHHH